MAGHQRPLSAVNSWSPEFIDDLFRQWSADPTSVDESWNWFFKGFLLARDHQETPAAGGIESPLIGAICEHYRSLGHKIAAINPLFPPADSEGFLDHEKMLIADGDWERVFNANFFSDSGNMTLRELVKALEDTYCRGIGAEFMHIQRRGERRFITDRMEPVRNQPPVSAEEKRRILRKLIQAERFEQFLAKNYTGQKRFSLEGGETLIPMLDTIVEIAPSNNCNEIVIGMAHRGRLNVLANNLQKPYSVIFAEFDDRFDPDSWDAGGGDVKYHKGASLDVKTSHGKDIHLTLTANPSHLEMVGPVVQGRSRAKLRHRNDDVDSVLPLVIHGEAAFAGQGIVAETFNMSMLRGYHAGGTIHIVINNQVGFTTSVEDARSSTYATDVAKIIGAPIFHVNADDPEAAVHVCKLALQYRQEYNRDVVIDLICFRKHGHNEGDEPSYTQPVMYEKIRRKDSILKTYSQKLIAEGSITAAEYEGMVEEFERVLEAEQQAARTGNVMKRFQASFGQGWVGFVHSYSHEPADTAISTAMAKKIGAGLAQWPADFAINPKVKRILETRVEAIHRGDGIDWATGEALAFGSLMLEGSDVRLSGQDVCRGTFSHRHASVTSIADESEFVPLQNLSENQGRFQLYDSPLSELSVVAFEYGYSLVDPNCLVCWEAQFGDFVNCAQPIIDEFIASAPYKWDRYSGLVMLLPHGYEGQGPDHSSGRVERFLQLCADDNMQVCNLTTPAQYFHALRRQLKRNFRAPLIVMTPKSLLRHPKATSRLEDFTSGSFREVLPDETANPKQVRTVLLTTGKIYYELLDQLEKTGRKDIAIIRLEQYYPFPSRQLEKAFAPFTQATEFVWVQEEPANNGAWEFIRFRLEELLGRRFRYIGRRAMASPAIGSHHGHEVEQHAILNAAIPPLESKSANGAAPLLKEPGARNGNHGAPGKPAAKNKRTVRK